MSIWHSRWPVLVPLLLNAWVICLGYCSNNCSRIDLVLKNVKPCSHTAKIKYYFVISLFMLVWCKSVDGTSGWWLIVIGCNPPELLPPCGCENLTSEGVLYFEEKKLHQFSLASLKKKTDKINKINGFLKNIYRVSVCILSQAEYWLEFCYLFKAWSGQSSMYATELLI